jgi:glutathione S-transferase
MFKITYFNIHGKAEPIRMLLKHAKIPFIDHRITKEEFSKLKSEGVLPAGQVPVMTDQDGRIYNQSGAILRSLGLKYGYYPTQWDQAFTCNWAMDTIDDFRTRDHFRLNFQPQVS